MEPAANIRMEIPDCRTLRNLQLTQTQPGVYGLPDHESKPAREPLPAKKLPAKCRNALPLTYPKVT